jgi:hypothetical protein
MTRAADVGETVFILTLSGGVLLSVHCAHSDDISRAKRLLDQTGAEDIASAGEKSVSTHGVETEAHSPR